MGLMLRQLLLSRPRNVSQAGICRLFQMFDRERQAQPIAGPVGAFVRKPRRLGPLFRALGTAGWVAATSLVCWGSLARADELRLGAAAGVITPPPGTPLAGYYNERPSEGVIDDILAKVAVLDDGQTKVALVVCDLLSLPRPTILEARQLIEKQTGIPGSHVMISATHQHTGPVVARESSRDELDGGSGDLGRRYTAGLPGLIAKTVREAAARLAPTRVSFARGFEQQLAFNRRYWMKDGTVGWNPGKLNPNTLRPVGPTDPEVGVVCFDSTNAKPQLTYVNFAMHPDTTGGARISADYPGALSRALAACKGPDMLTIFANGACGDLNHLNVAWPVPQQGTNEANRLGTILAAAVLKACIDLKPVADTTLRARREVLQLPLAKITDADAAKAREVMKRMKQAKFMELVSAFKVLDVAGRSDAPWEVEVQVVALGKDLAWVSLPGEIFVELGLNIKAASPFRQTHIVELANGAIGYIPNRSAYAEGNYEVVSARCAEGSGEMLVTAAVRMLEELYKEAGGENAESR
jgi:neutral ceramidase